ncbi:MAG TPA: extracellular solute-binding protein [Eubacteriales bacterium]|nr:extracellular solute-binding protein [Eubacteriales bacterium]
MKKLLALLLVCVMVFGLFGCTSEPAATEESAGTSETAATQETTDETTSDGTRKQITFWFWGAATSYQETMVDVLCGWYNNSQDEYELTMEFRNTVDTDIPVALAAGTGPDIVYASGPSYTSTYAQEGLVLDLNDYAEQYGWQDRVLSVMYDACTVDGTLYSIPGAMVVGGLYYNKELFDEKGWEPPTTWDEMIALFDAAQAEGIYALGAGNKGWKPCNDHFSSMIINHAISPSAFYNALTGEASFNTPEMVSAVNLSAEWYQKGYLAGEDYVNLDSQEVMQLLADKRCAMVMAPTLYTQFVAQSTLADNPDAVGFVPMPTTYTDEPVYDVSMTSNYAINASTPYPDECAKILDYILTSEFVVEMTKNWPGYWTIPVKDLADVDTSSLTGLSLFTIECVKDAIPYIDEGNFAFHPSTFFPPATVTAFEDIDTVWQGVLTAEQFCETVAKELDTEIADGLVCPLAKPAY